MLARASGTIPTYTPSLYLPGSMGRYRQYPRVVKTSIPGAGVKGGKLVWGEQTMNLWGAPRVRFSTARLPLLGLGQSGADIASGASLIAGLISNPEATLRTQGPRVVQALDSYIVGPVVEAAVARSTPYLVRYFAPPLVTMYLMTALSTWFSYEVLISFRRGALKPNRRRKRK